jgi:chaperone required for assembly of F1-ATPase
MKGKRFYKSAEPAETGSGWEIRLDGKGIRTPLGAPLAVPSRALADAVAAEWAGQGERIDPASLPLTRLANTAIDRCAGADRAALLAALLRYADSELICHFAESPEPLAARQRAQWQPLLDWAGADLGARLVSVAGVMPADQPDAARRGLSAALETLDPWRLSAVQAAVGAGGSLVIALALAAGRLDAEQAYQAALLDELYQAEIWGADSEAVSRRAAIAAELSAAARFLSLLN